jgi:Beta-propeller repeat
MRAFLSTLARYCVLFSFLLSSCLSHTQSLGDARAGPLSYPSASQPARTLPLSVFASLPLQFEENRGQADREARFLARGPGYTLLLDRDGLRLALRQTRQISMRLVGAQIGTISGREPSPSKTNYYLGNDPADWHLDIRSYRSVTYSRVYNGIDLIYHGSGQQLEYDFVVAPGADPTQVRMRFAGLRPVLDGEDLAFQGIDRLRVKALHAYQWINRNKKAVQAAWRVRAGEVSIQLGSYDRDRELIIDPVFFYGTYIGGAENDAAVSIVPASQAGYFFVALSTSSPQINDPPAQGADSPAPNPNPVPGTDTLILGIDATAAPAPPSPLPPFGGSLTSNYPQLVISSVTSQTYLGGKTGSTAPTSMVGDQNGNLYITGTTNNSASFAPSGSQPCSQPCTGYVAKFATSVSAGSHTATITPEYSFALPATPNAIAVDTAGNAYLTGSAYATVGKPMLTIPAADSAFQSTAAAAIASSANPHAFLLELDPAGVTLFCSYIGGSGTDQGNALTVSGNTVVVAGQTSSNDFPKSSSAYQGSNGGGDQDGFVLSASNLVSAPTLNFATYLGGSATDTVASIAFAPSGNLVLTGSTNSPQFPTQANPSFTKLLWPIVNNTDTHGNETTQLPTAAPTVLALPTAPAAGVQDAFVTSLSADGAHLLFTDFLGGNDTDGVTTGKALLVDSVGVVYVTGSSTGVHGQFLPGAVIGDSDPISFPNQPPTGVYANIFFAQIDPTGKYLLEATLAGSFGADQANGLAISSPLSSAGVVSIVGTTTPAPNSVTGTNNPELFYDAGISAVDAVNPDSPNKSAVANTTGFMVQEALAGFCSMKLTQQAGTLLTFSGPCVSGTQSGTVYASPASSSSTGKPFSAPIAVTASGGVLTALVTVDVSSLGGGAANFMFAFLPLGAIGGEGTCTNQGTSLQGCGIVTAGGGAGTLFNVMSGALTVSLACTTNCSYNGVSGSVVVGQPVTLTATVSDAIPDTVTWTSSQGIFTGPNPAASITFTPGGTGGPVVIEATPAANPSLQPATISLNTISAGGSGVSGGSLTILSSTSKMVAGTIFQFTANQPVTWTASAGTIDANGLFTAPTPPPASGKVTITATAKGSSSTSATTQVSVFSQPMLVVPTTTTLPSGGSVKIPVSVAAGTGITGESLLFTCAPATLPTGVSCAFSPNPLTNGSSSPSMLTLSSTPVGGSLPAPWSPLSLGGSSVVFAVAMLWRRSKPRHRGYRIFFAGFTFACSTLLGACGTNGSFSTASQQGHLSGSYTITLVATGATQGAADLSQTVATVPLSVTVK